MYNMLFLSLDCSRLESLFRIPDISTSTLRREHQWPTNIGLPREQSTNLGRQQGTRICCDNCRFRSETYNSIAATRRKSKSLEAQQGIHARSVKVSLQWSC
jgi:hypothetical protein